MKLKKYFYFKNPGYPTQGNIIQKLQECRWEPGAFPGMASFGDRNFAFDKAACECLEFKHRLAALLSSHCPEITPLSYFIHDKNWPAVIQTLESCPSLVDITWILKPSLLNNGQFIKILENIEAIKAHFSTTKRLGGEHVLQVYIKNPHLLRDNRKYSIRLFLILTNYQGAFLYPDGYFNVAMKPYPLGQYVDLRPHLTNEHLAESEPNVVQIPTARFLWFHEIYPALKEMTSSVVSALMQEYPSAFILKKTKKIAIFGLDFMVDANKRIWLLEANHGPCFPVSLDHPLQSYLYQAFWDDLVRQFVLPIAGENAESKTLFPFESLL